MAKRELAWSKEELSALRHLASKGSTIEEISEKVHRSRHAVVLTARRYDIPIYQPGRKWSAEDRDFLRRNWGKVPLRYLSQRLHRRPSAVAEMAYKMKLDSVYQSSEDVGLMDFVRGTGISRDRILKNLVPKWGFPIKRIRNGTKQVYYYVDFEAILPWMEAHQDLYDASKITEGYFVEPDWLKEKRRRDIADPSYLNGNVRRRAWREQDVARLKYLAKKGLTPRQIAEQIDRTPGAVIDKMWKIQM